MESHHAKWKVEVQQCCKCHLLNPANTMQHERLYLPNVADAMQNARFYLHNAGWGCRMLNILHHIAHTTHTLLFVSLLFWPWLFRQLSFFLALQSCTASWLHGFVCVHLFTATNATSVRKSQTRPTPKQRPQHQQLLVCSLPQQQPQQQQQQQKQQQHRKQQQQETTITTITVATNTKTTPTRTAAITATRITKQTRINDYITDDNQPPTTNNNLQIACQMKDSSSKMLQIHAKIMQNQRFQLPMVATGKQNGRIQLQNAAKSSSNYKMLLIHANTSSMQDGRF